MAYGFYDYSMNSLGLLLIFYFRVIDFIDGYKFKHSTHYLLICGLGSKCFVFRAKCDFDIYNFSEFGF
jgi:hypothetical protein